MPLPVLARVYRLTLNYLYSGGPIHAHNVIHLFDELGTQDAADCALAFDVSTVVNQWKTMSPNASLVSVDCLPLDGVSVTTHRALTTPRAGGGTDEGITNAAQIVTLYSAERGRDKRGRVYLPFLDEGSQNAGTINATKRDQVTAAWTTFLANILTNDFSLVVASYEHVDYIGVASCVARSYAGTMRRRMKQFGSF